jgi:hypothetical protein
LKLRSRLWAKAGDYGSDRAQGSAAHAVHPRGEPSAVVVGETQWTSKKLTPQKPVLFDQVRECLPLPAVQPAGQHTEHHLQRHGVDHERSLPTGPQDSDREMELRGYYLSRQV